MATITVSTSAQLQTALSSAHGGDTILLAAGSYGDFSVADLSFSSQVTIQSADASHPAQFRSISVSGSQNLAFENLNVHFTPNATTYAWDAALFVTGSSHIDFIHNEIVGGLSVNGVLPTATKLDSTQDVIGLPAGRAATVAHSSEIQFIDNEINTFDRGLVLQDATGLTITGNDIHNLRRTPIDGGDVSQTVISGNYLHDLHPWNWGYGDHADFIHIWTVPSLQSGASAGLIIKDNYLAQGSGTAVLGIYLDDNSNGLGFSGAQITGNVIYNGNGQGMRLENLISSKVDGNVLLQSSGELKVGPTIMARDGTSELSITHNIVSGLDLAGLTGDSRGNVLVQSVDSALSGYSGIQEGQVLTWLEAMQVRQQLTGIGYTSGATDWSNAGIDGGTSTDASTPPPTTSSTDSVSVTGTNTVDVIHGTDGNDTLFGHAGNDTLYGEGGNDRLNGGAGADKMVGGLGDDTYYVDNAGDSVVESTNSGTDTVVSTISHNLESSVERLVLSGSANIDGTGNSLDNKIVGNIGSNVLNGGSGNDILIGNAGDDYLIGGLGTDILTGGTGNDHFIFRDLSTDRVTDFTSGQDVLDLESIDANSSLTGNQAFTFIGTHAFTHTAGEVHYQQIGSNTFVTADMNGDGIADFTVRLDGLHTLTSHDFIL